MALLRINDDWQITSDSNCWILQKRSVVTKTDNPENVGKEVWKNEGYYTSLPDAVEGMVRRNVRVPDDLKGIINIIAELTKLINEKFGSIETALQTVKAEDDLEDFLS
jgi:hypothetical protein